MSSEPGTLSAARRKSFAVVARAAIEKHVPESRTAADAHWVLAPNAVWVRWPREGGRFAYLGVHRHLDWVSGEAGISDEPQELDDLMPIPGVSEGPRLGYRVRLGFLLDGQDRWWPAGPDEPALIERLEWMALQLRVRGEAYFARPRGRR
jgi:hypothetical protein